MGEVLSTVGRAHFVLQMRRQMNSAVHRRMNVLLLLDDGLSVPYIAQVLCIDAGMVRGHPELYRTKGRAGIEALAYEGASSALEPGQEAILVAEPDERVCLTAKETGTFIIGYQACHTRPTHWPNILSAFSCRK